MAMQAKAGIADPAQVLTLVVRAAQVLGPADREWCGIRDFGRVVAADPDPVALVEAGDRLLDDLGVLEDGRFR